MNGFEPFLVYDPTPVSQRNQDVMFAGPLWQLMAASWRIR